MDFTTIQSKLKLYPDFDSFKKDVLLVFENAKTYNKKDTIYHKEAVKIENWVLFFIMKQAKSNLDKLLKQIQKSYSKKGIFYFNIDTGKQKAKTNSHPKTTSLPTTQETVMPNSKILTLDQNNLLSTNITKRRRDTDGANKKKYFYKRRKYTGDGSIKEMPDLKDAFLSALYFPFNYAPLKNTTKSYIDEGIIAARILITHFRKRTKTS